jgi:hydroxymethylpyrimidine pyrophosphatase-like HAD family hydrolase
MAADCVSQDEGLVQLALFDVDGPVTHPESRKIEQPEILDLTLLFLTDRNGYVAYNTGRASNVVYDRVISPLLARAIAQGIDPVVISRRISVFAEKGAVVSVWNDEQSQWQERVDPATVVPAEMRSAVTDLLRNDREFQIYVFYDSDKQTMVSVEMRRVTAEPTPVPVTVRTFKPIAERFTAEIRQLASERGYRDLEVDCTTIAVDVQRRGVGKDLGTRLALRWLQDLGKRIARIYCFGDSRSDVAMAAEAYFTMSHWFTDAGSRVVYVHVGENIVIDGHFEVRTFPDMYGLGTVAYLKTLVLVHHVRPDRLIGITTQSRELRIKGDRNGLWP